MTTPPTTHDADLAKFEELLDAYIGTVEDCDNKPSIETLSVAEKAYQTMLGFVSASLRDKALLDDLTTRPICMESFSRDAVKALLRKEGQP